MKNLKSSKLAYRAARRQVPFLDLRPARQAQEAVLVQQVRLELTVQPGLLVLPALHPMWRVLQVQLVRQVLVPQVRLARHQLLLALQAL
jgi:hypothetical protein